jgi:hypothetical protein
VGTGKEVSLKKGGGYEKRSIRRKGSGKGKEVSVERGGVRENKCQGKGGG